METKKTIMIKIEQLQDEVSQLKSELKELKSLQEPKEKVYKPTVECTRCEHLLEWDRTLHNMYGTEYASKEFFCVLNNTCDKLAYENT